jgi:serpin B
MRMSDAFCDGLANFTKIADDSLFISSIVHKTFISVDERGTKAGAATLIEGSNTSVAPKAQTVYLDRPFVYMIIDCETNLPIFIGTVLDI